MSSCMVINIMWTSKCSWCHVMIWHPSNDPIEKKNMFSCSHAFIPTLIFYFLGEGWDQWISWENSVREHLTINCFCIGIYVYLEQNQILCECKRLFLFVHLTCACLSSQSNIKLSQRLSYISYRSVQIWFRNHKLVFFPWRHRWCLFYCKYK